MSIIQLLLFAVGLMLVMVLGYSALSGPNPAKEGARRLQGLRERHSESTKDKVEAQLRKAVAARKPKMHQIAGSSSRIDAPMDVIEAGLTLSLSAAAPGTAAAPPIGLRTISPLRSWLLSSLLLELI